jgi:8-oxo-dGTP pyrophosphatase MutT (NUDIX family)
MSVTLRDAATVLLVRDARGEGAQGSEGAHGGVEVCMLRRNLESEFVAGAYVFPGGSVDPGDEGPSAEARCEGLTDEEASAILGVESGGLAHWVAALRECFEEAGVLVARSGRDSGSDRDPERDGDPLLDTSDPARARRFADHRRALNEGRVDFLGVCEREELMLAVDALHYVGHWITPELSPRRYDTRFFVAVTPPGQVASHDDGETIANIWISPSGALALYAAGEIELLPPTVANLQHIEEFDSAAEVIEWARAVTDVPVVLPIVVVEGERVLILRPGDAGYERALADRLTSGVEVDRGFEEAARSLWGSRAEPA